MLSVEENSFRSGDPAYAFGRTAYRSAQARQVKDSGYGLDVVRIGHLRFSQHQTREEIWHQLREETAIQLPERHVQIALRRGHWLIENQGHRSKDVNLAEDASLLHAGHGPTIVATLRDVA